MVCMAADCYCSCRLPVAHPTSSDAASHSPGRRCINETAWHAGCLMLPRSDCYPPSHLTNIWHGAHHQESQTQRATRGYYGVLRSTSRLDRERRLWEKRTIVPLHPGVSPTICSLMCPINTHTRHASIPPYRFQPFSTSHSGRRRTFFRTVPGG